MPSLADRAAALCKRFGIEPSQQEHLPAGEPKQRFCAYCRVGLANPPYGLCPKRPKASPPPDANLAEVLMAAAAPRDGRDGYRWWRISPGVEWQAAPETSFSVGRGRDLAEAVIDALEAAGEKT